MLSVCLRVGEKTDGIEAFMNASSPLSVCLQAWRVDSTSTTFLHTFPAGGRLAGASSCQARSKDPANVVKVDLLFLAGSALFLFLYFFSSFKIKRVLFLFSSLPIPASQLSCSNQNSQITCQRAKTRPVTKTQ